MCIIIYINKRCFHQVPEYDAAALASHLVQFVHSRADGAESLVWDAAHRKHTVQDAPVVHLERHGIEMICKTFHGQHNFCLMLWLL